MKQETSGPSDHTSAARKAKLALILVMAVFVAINIFFGFYLLHQKPVTSSVSSGNFTKSVPDFNLTNQAGQPFSLEDLKGKHWVAAFFFTRCPGPCPMISANLAQLHQDFTDDANLHFVSFSIDPSYDTPEVLSRYARSFYADLSRWTFLTGDQEAIHDLSMNGFYSAVMETDPETAQEAGPFIHGTRIYIVDTDSNIVAAYDGTTAEGIQQTKSKLKELIR
ncbi:MAG: SCO family protein [Verrucomicrobiota bacterium]